MLFGKRRPPRGSLYGLCYRADILELLSSEFYKQTKIKVPGMLLAAFIETERKGARWCTMRSVGFGDIGEIA